MEILKNNDNMDRKPDKVNGDVLYYDDEHVYIDKKTKSKFTSVTTLIKKYANEFDSEFWSSYKALEKLIPSADFENIKVKLRRTKKFNIDLLDVYNIKSSEFVKTKQEILDSYAETSKIACERGTNIHAEFENKYYSAPKHSLSKFGLEGEFQCIKDYYELDLDKGVYPEYLIYRTSADGILKVAGQVDLLIKDGNEIQIHDYKTNKEIKKKSFFDMDKKSYSYLKYPLNHLMDCNYIHYTLQLSLYAYLLQQINPEFKIKCLKIIHIDHNNKRKDYEVEYLKDDIERMLKHYKKQIIIREQLDRDIK